MNDWADIIRNAGFLLKESNGLKPITKIGSIRIDLASDGAIILSQSLNTGSPDRISIEPDEIHTVISALLSTLRHSRQQ